MKNDRYRDKRLRLVGATYDSEGVEIAAHIGVRFYQEFNGAYMKILAATKLPSVFSVAIAAIVVSISGCDKTAAIQSGNENDTKNETIYIVCEGEQRSVDLTTPDNVSGFGLVDGNSGVVIRGTVTYTFAPSVIEKSDGRRKQWRYKEGDGGWVTDESFTPADKSSTLSSSIDVSDIQIRVRKDFMEKKFRKEDYDLELHKEISINRMTGEWYSRVRSIAPLANGRDPIRGLTTWSGKCRQGKQLF